MQYNEKDRSEIENLALATELARQLCHEFSNFIYNVFLQCAIVESSASANPGDWENIHRDAKRMAGLLQDWEHFQYRFSFDEATIDLNLLVRQVADEMSAAGRIVRLAPSILSETLSVGGAAVPSRHLLRLLLEEVFHTWEEVVGTIPDVSVHTNKVNSAAFVQIVAQPASEPTGLPGWDVGREEELRKSLTAATCRSLAVRLGAAIHHERHADGRFVLQVTFPHSMMQGLL